MNNQMNINIDLIYVNKILIYIFIFREYHDIQHLGINDKCNGIELTKKMNNKRHYLLRFIQ